MAQVYIDSLTLENFGPFYGEHTLDFHCLDGKCHTLIGGKTGAGKTHLLRGLYLAVVGESGIGDLKRLETGSEATRFTFEKSLNRLAASQGKDTVRLKVVVTVRDDGPGSRTVEFVREIRYRPNSPPVWKHYAIRRDSSDHTKEEQCNLIEDDQIIHKLRDAFLPRHLARFFFFDAERSQSISLGQQDIVEGVSRILGLWTYAELENDLRQLIQQKIPRVFSTETAGLEAKKRLIDLTTEVLRVSGHLDVQKAARAECERTLHQVEDELRDVEDELQSSGSVDPDELSRCQERRNQLTAARAELEAKLTQAWEIELPLALLGKYRMQLHDYLLSEERRREWESAKSTVEPKIPQVQEDVFGNVPPEFALPPKVEAFYATRLKEALHRLFHPPPEGMSERVFVTDRNDTSAQIRARLVTRLNGVRDLAEMFVKIERIDAEVRELEKKLKQMQEDRGALEKGRALYEKRGVLLSKRDELKKRITELNAEIQRLEVVLADLKRQETTQREIVEKAEKGQSLATLAGRYREAAAEIRTEAARQMRQCISEHVGQLWVDITEREHEFAGMEFDERWQCWLIRRDGTKLMWEETNTSAGQRQVRMLAFYEALRRLAKLIPPLVVDTPLARLDKEVRENVLDRLYLTGHQSIILSTNAEIDPEGPLFERIRGRLARVYTLRPHGRPDSPNYEVRVTYDYFGKDL